MQKNQKIKIKKKWENVFRFWDNCIWKCCYKLSLLRREYLLSAVNGLANSLRTCISVRKAFQTWIAYTGINKSGKGAVVKLWTVFLPVYHVTSQRVLRIGTF